MPFGESMNSILKSNKGIMLDKSQKFRRTSGRYEGSQKEVFDFPEDTPHVLMTIRHRLQRERLHLRWKLWIVFILILISLVATLFQYQKSHYL